MPVAYEQDCSHACPLAAKKTVHPYREQEHYALGDLLTFKWNMEKIIRLLITPSTVTPTTVRSAPPLPPNKLVPPSTAATIRVELHAEACRGHRAADARRHDDSGQRRQDPAKDEGDEASSLHVQARQPPGRRVQTENE